jgi:RNA polymerase sigma-70 factor (ECF subfamily)
VDHEKRFEAEALHHLRGLYGTAYRMAHNPHDAEDLVRETYLRAYRASDPQGTNMRAWLHTILYRVRADALRRSGRERVLDDRPAMAPSQGKLGLRGETIARALEALPEGFKAAVVLRDVQEFGYGEIAQILAISMDEVTSRIHRGRALLRQALDGKKP